MKYYLAPLDGITEFIYRNSYKKFLTILINGLYLLLYLITVKFLKYNLHIFPQ